MELDQSVKFAIFGCPEEITEEQLEEVRAFVEYIKIKAIKNDRPGAPTPRRSV